MILTIYLSNLFIEHHNLNKLSNLSQSITSFIMYFFYDCYLFDFSIDIFLKRSSSDYYLAGFSTSFFYSFFAGSFFYFYSGMLTSEVFFITCS